MTQQDDITQRLRDNADLDEAEHGNARVVQLEREAADEIERLRAELSQVRAPVAGELPHWEEISAKLERDETLTPLELFIHENEPAGGDADAWRDQLSDALASAPVDPEATEVDFLVRVFENLDTWRAEDWNELLERRPAILAMLRPLVLASAPVAGEAIGYVDSLYLACRLRGLPCNGTIHRTPTSDATAPIYAAPQASAEALEVARAALMEIADLADVEADQRGVIVNQALTKIARMTAAPQADKDGGQWEPQTPEQIAADMRNMARSEGFDWPEPDGGQQLRWRVTDDMRYAVRFAPSSAHWSERLKEFFGPDAREGIDALESQLREARAMLDRQPKLRADASAVRRALIAASNYIDTLGGDSKSYRAALSATQAEQGERDA